MTVYTYSEARQQFASLLERAQREGGVRVRRRDGQMFVILAERSEKSPLDVGGVDIGLSEGEIVRVVREGRERKWKMPQRQRRRTKSRKVRPVSRSTR